MAILYIDYENGNNNHGGSSFNVLASGNDGRISGSGNTRTFSSDSSNFADDGSLINQYLSIFTGSAYVIYLITDRINSTSLTITILGIGGATLNNQTVNREFFIGGRWQSTSAATTARLFPGDEIRFKASPDPVDTEIDSTWTSEGFKPTQTIQSSTNATPISIRRDGHGYITGDFVVITGHTVNTNANGVWKITVTDSNNFTLNDSVGNGVGGTTGTVRQINNKIISLASSPIQNIASDGNIGSSSNPRTIWTASSNVSCSLDSTSFKEGHVSDLISIAAAFTTGKAAVKSFSSKDLSSYSQLSFWINQNSGTISVDGDISLCLCSDSGGNTVVHTFNIPGSSALNFWYPVTIDNLSALSNDIKSVALYVNVDRGAQNFRLSNIIVCKAPDEKDAICLNSLVSKSENNNAWICIQSILDKLIFIDGGSNSFPTTLIRGYCEETINTQTVSLYRRETTQTIKGVSSGAVIQSISRDGEPNSRIVISGGWDRSSMSTKNSQTYFDGLNGVGNGLTLSSRDYIDLDNIGLVRYTIGLNIAGSEADPSTNLYLSPLQCNHCATNGISLSNCAFISLNNVYVFGNVDSGLNMTSGANSNIITNVKGFSNLNQNLNLNANLSNKVTNFLGINAVRGIQILSSSTNILKNIECNNNLQYGIFFISSGNRNLIYALQTSDNGISSIGSSNSLDNVLFGASLSEPLEFRDISPYSNGNVYSENQDNISDNHIIYTDYGQINSETEIRHTNSGLAWAISPTNIRRDSDYPLDFKIGTIAVSANNLLTIKAWMLRNSTNLTLRLRIPGDQILGVSNDVIAEVDAPENEWQEIYVQCTPTEDGVIEFFVDAYGGSTHTGYIDDITITQT
jgi:hypothetical protein